MPKTDQLGKRIIHPANRSKRVFKLDYRDMTALTGRQRPSKGKEKHGQMITGGLAPKYHLGDPYIVDEAFIQRFRGTKHERSQMYRRQMEWRHQHAIPVEARRVGIRHFLRQVLISQGPLTAERLYAVSQIFPAEPLKSWDEVASSLNIPKMRVPPSPKHLVSSPNKLIEAIEKLRRERYVVRLTLRKWKRLCIAAGTDDGMNFGADARPVGDGERVYVPREIFYPVQKLAAQTKKPNTEEVPMLWRPNLIPSRLVSEEARTCLPSMAPWCVCSHCYCSMLRRAQAWQRSGGSSEAEFGRGGSRDVGEADGASALTPH